MTVRVAFDITPTLGTRTGIGNVVAHLYKSLGNNAQLELAPYSISYNAKNFSDSLPANNISINYPAKLLIEVWKRTDKFSFEQRLGKIDLLHATNFIAPPTRSPLLITIHDVTMLKYPDLVSPSIRSLAPVIRRRLKQGAHVHVPAEAIKKDVLEHFADEIQKESHVHVVPFSVPDLIDAQPSADIKKLSEGDPFILCIGALEPRKNHARLIESFEIVYEKNPHIRLLLVGPDGPARPSIDNAMAKLSHNARNRIIITGKVSSIDRTWLLKNAEMVSYPSLYEGFGLPLLEAMTAHTPIVTTKEGALVEVGGDAAHYVDAYDSNDIARGMLDILESKDLRDKLVVAGISRAKNFSWEQSAELLANVYLTVANENRDS